MNKNIMLAKRGKLKFIAVLILAVITVVVICYVITSLQITFNDTTKHGAKEMKFLQRMRGPVQQDDLNFIKVIESKFIDRPSSKPYNLSRDTFYQTYASQPGTFNIKEILEVLFSGQSEGFFVEAGALDGEFLSNTLWLEKELGWTGLLVEPNPYSYRKLLTKHRKAWTTNTCLSSSPYPYESTLVDVSLNIEYMRDGSKYFPWAFRGASRLIGIAVPPGYDDLFLKTTESFVKVQCLPITSLLLALNQTEVDFFSLDIQGLEKQVIKTIPFDKIHINALVVEDVGTPTPDLEFRKLFTEAGLRVIYCDGENYFFVSERLFAKHNLNEATECLKHF